MADEASPKKKSKRKWFILIFLLLLLGGAAAGAWFFFFQNKLMAPSAEAPAKAEKAKGEAASAQGSTTIALPAFTTNLADPLGQRFIRINIEVEAANPKVADDMAKNNARIRDSIIILLSSKTYSDIAGTESKLMLKSEISERLSAILGQGKIHQVFITDMVIQ